MMWLVTCILVLVCLPRLATQCLNYDVTSKLDVQYDNLLLHNLVLWDTVQDTRLDCFMLCFDDPFCVRFQYREVNRVCVGLKHSPTIPATSAVQGYRLFDIDKAVVGESCSIDVDCLTLKNSYCHQGACRCNIGYDVYLTRCRKLTECPQLLGAVTVYNNSVINASNFYNSMPGVTQSYCQDACATQSLCRSADYDRVVNTCFLASYSWLSVPGSDRLTHVNFVHIQKQCQWS